MESHSRQC